MYMLLRYPAGITLEALLLARRKNRMRVVARGLSDTIELRRSGTLWLDPDRQPVEFDFMMSAGAEFESQPVASSVRVAGLAAG